MGDPKMLKNWQKLCFYSITFLPLRSPPLNQYGTSPCWILDEWLKNHVSQTSRYPKMGQKSMFTQKLFCLSNLNLLAELDWNKAEFEHWDPFEVILANVRTDFTFGLFPILVNFLAELDQNISKYDHWGPFEVILSNVRIDFTFNLFPKLYLCYFWPWQ